MELETELRNYVLEKHMSGEDPQTLTNEKPLFSSGILDSLGVIQMVAYLEQKYGIDIETRDIVAAHFESVNQLAAFVRGKLQEKKGSK